MKLSQLPNSFFFFSSDLFIGIEEREVKKMLEIEPKPIRASNFVIYGCFLAPEQEITFSHLLIFDKDPIYSRVIMKRLKYSCFPLLASHRELARSLSLFPRSVKLVVGAEIGGPPDGGPNRWSFPNFQSLTVLGDRSPEKPVVGGEAQFRADLLSGRRLGQVWKERGRRARNCVDNSWPLRRNLVPAGRVFGVVWLECGTGTSGRRMPMLGISRNII